MLKDNREYDDLLTTTVIFSRGCPYIVISRDARLEKYSPGIRFRSPDLIREEIEYPKCDYKINGISLLDEIGFPADPKKAIPHIEAIGRTRGEMESAVPR